MEQFNLTKYSRGSGCGCKIAPGVLEEILSSNKHSFTDPNLLVGNNTNDDAAVYNLGNGTALISTVDFFMPIVDDPYEFGQIAAANAISDVYAMGGKPVLATAILGWPIDKLPAALASKVIEGAREKCLEAGIALAGGHSIDSLEPLFGLSVNGLVNTSQIKTNAGSKVGNLIYITKEIGLGIMATALKRGVISEEHKTLATGKLKQLNSIGEKTGFLSYVTAMTDVTGFGLLGHLIEMMEAAGTSAEIDYTKIHVLDSATSYSSKMIVPDNTYRNWNANEKKTKNIGPESFFTLNDPQTNGGLMICIDANYQADFETFLKENNLGKFAQPIGLVTEKKEFVVEIK